MAYKWAANAFKLQRAEAMCPGKSEAEIKEAYIKLGGKVIETEPDPEVDPISGIGVEAIKSDTNEPISETPAEAPKKRSRKIKSE